MLVGLVTTGLMQSLDSVAALPLPGPKAVAPHAMRLGLSPPSLEGPMGGV
jgi:hypothetical protein